MTLLGVDVATETEIGNLHSLVGGDKAVSTDDERARACAARSDAYRAARSRCTKLCEDRNTMPLAISTAIDARSNGVKSAALPLAGWQSIRNVRKSPRAANSRIIISCSVCVHTPSKRITCHTNEIDSISSQCRYILVPRLGELLHDCGLFEKCALLVGPGVLGNHLDSNTADPWLVRSDVRGRG